MTDPKADLLASRDRWKRRAEYLLGAMRHFRLHTATLEQEKLRQFQSLRAIRQMADATTGINRSQGDERKSGAVGAVEALVARLTALEHINAQLATTAQAEQLRLEALKAEAESTVTRLVETLEAVRAERDRLREALDRYAKP